MDIKGTKNEPLRSVGGMVILIHPIVAKTR